MKILLFMAALLPAQQPDVLVRHQAIRFACKQYPEAKPLAEGFEDGAFALNACQPEAARALIEAYNAGKLEPIRASLPQLLKVVAQHRGVGWTREGGDPHYPDRLALYIVGHVRELQNPDFVATFLAGPVECSLGLPVKAAPVLREAQPQRPAPFEAQPQINVQEVKAAWKFPVNEPPPSAQQATPPPGPPAKEPERMIKVGGFAFPMPDMRIVIGIGAIVIAILMALFRGRASAAS